MSLPSKFADHPCKHCGVNIKKGDEIHKIDATSSWCVNINCPKAPASETPKTDVKPGTINVNGPFDEAELITRWASERAYKIAMAEVSDFSKLSPQEKSGLGQKTGMLTRCLVDTTIELMKMHGVKSKYGDGV